MTRRDPAAGERRRARERDRHVPVHWCHDCSSPVEYVGWYRCTGCGLDIPMGRLHEGKPPVTSHDTPALVGCEQTTTQGGPMPSHASAAAAALQKDRAKLTAVPDLPPDPPKPQTAGDRARAAARDTLPDYQQAEYDKLTADGTRHVTALAKARTVPDPAAQAAAQDDVEKLTADLFAAFQTGQVGAAAPAESLAVTVTADGPQDQGEVEVPLVPDAPAPQPAPAAPKPAVVSAPKPAPAKPAPKPAPPAPADGTCQRYIGTVTATGLDGAEHVYDCEHAARNGHMDVATAETCAKRLLRNHPGTPGSRVHPVPRDRSGRRLA